MNRPLSLTLAFALTLSLTGCGDAPDPYTVAGDGDSSAVVIPDDAPLVAFLGDSISAGLHLPRDQAFPNVLQDIMARDGTPFRLVNAGISGDTTAGGLRRVDWILKQVPDVVVVELGGNDGLRGQDLDTVEENLRGIVDRIQERGAEVLILGMRIPPNYGVEYTKRFRGMYEALAEETGADLLPFFMDGVAGRPDLNLPDGIHPSAEGHRKLAENVRPALEEILERLGG